MKKKRIILVITISFFIIIYGFITISNNLPRFIKDRSLLKINYSFIPFDFRVELGEYSLYINRKVATNIRTSSAQLINNVESKLYDNTSHLLNKTSNAFKTIESKVGDVIQNKIRWSKSRMIFKYTFHYSTLVL